MKNNDDPSVIEIIDVPANYRKKTTIAANLSYNTIKIFKDRVEGYLNKSLKMVWRFDDYIGVDIVEANMNSQFAQVVFLTGINSKRKFVGLDFAAAQNDSIMQDTNRILFCSGMFSFSKTNDYAEEVGRKIQKAFNDFKDSTTDVSSQEPESATTLSSADEIRKYKSLLDDGIITQEEFDLKKKELLGL